MKPDLSKAKKQIPVIILLCAFALLAVIYYFIYIPGNERQLDQQHFHWLQNVDDNIRKKVNDADTMLKGYLGMYYCYLKKNKDKKDTTGAWSINTGSSMIVARLLRGDDSRQSGSSNTSKHFGHNLSMNDDYSIETDSLIKKVSITWKSKFGKPSSHLADYLFENDDYSIGTDSSKKIISIIFRRKEACIGIQFDFADFVKPLLPPDVFDHYVIFCGGNYIYEDFHSGLSYKNDDSLLMDGKSKTIAGATIMQQEVGGVAYRIFLQPIIFGDKKLIIAGFHSASRFESEKKTIPENLVRSLLIVAFALLLFMPWLRILFMGKYDRLQLKNIFWVSLVTKLLVSILFLIFFGFIPPLTDNTVDESATYIDSTIGVRFNKEIMDAQNVVDCFIDLKHSAGFSNYDDIVDLNLDRPRYQLRKANCQSAKDTGSIPKKVMDVFNYNLRRFRSKVREVNWLSRDGKVLYNWTSKPQNDISQHYSDRRYLKDIVSNSNLVGPNDTALFALDQVISRSNGDFCTVIAKGLAKDTVVAMAFKLTCVDSMILPLGYSAMIIDNSGLVRYHSQSEKNLKENICDELSNLSRNGFQSSIKGRFQFHCQASHYEKRYDVWVKPLKGYPYFIVVMRRQRYVDSRDVQTFSFSLSMIFLFLLIALIDLSVMIFTSARRSPFKKQFFVTGWLWPRRSSKVEYIHATIYHLIVLVELLCIQRSDVVSFIEYSFMLVVTLPALTLYLNGLFGEKYERQRIYYRRFKKNCTVGLIVLLLLYLLIAGFVLHWEICRLTDFVLSLAGLYCIQRVVRENGLTKEGSDKVDKQEKRPNLYIAWYTAMLFTKLIITCGIPATFFYISAYNYEQNLTARYKQLSMIQQIEKNRIPLDSASTHLSIYKDTADIANFVTSYVKLERLNRADLTAAKIFNFCGQKFGHLTFDNDDFYLTEADDGSVHYNNIFGKDSVSRTFVPIPSKPGQYLSISGSPRKILYQLPGLCDNCPFWILFLVTLCLCFFALLFIIKKVFAKDVFYLDAVNSVDSKLELENKAEVRMFIVAIADEYKKYASAQDSAGAVPRTDLDYLDYNRVCKYDKEDDFYEALKTKMSVLKNTTWNSPLCILNFEEDFSDLSMVKRKVFFLEEVLSLKREIIILSAKHPILLAEEMRNMADSKDAPVKKRLRAKMDLLLGRFTTTIHPLDRLIKDTVNIETDPSYPNAASRYIAYETKFTYFLHELGHSLTTNGTRYTHRLSDAITLKIQALAHNFYMEIWDALTEKEKFVLHDLAEDGLVNTTNMFSLNLLIARGIIVREDGGLHIFNRSFRNFVVTAIGREEMAKLNHTHQLNSRWGSLNRLLVFSGITVLLFLGITQDHTYTQAVAALTGLGSAVAAIVNILNTVSSRSSKEKADASS